MKLSDQEQTILRAIEREGSNGIAEISKVVKAVGYPKAVTKRTITRLAEKGLVAIHRHDWPHSLTPAQRKLMVRIGASYYSAVSVRERNPTRFEIGRRLSKAEKEEVLRSLGDSYKDHRAPKVLKSFNRDGDPIYGYEYNQDFMYRSDITGRLIRHYVTLPDGRRAHPTELYPNVTKSEIDKWAMEREAAEQVKQSRDRSRDERIAKPGEELPGQTLKGLANAKYQAKGRKIEGSYFAQDAGGRIVRVDGKDAADVAYYEARGFMPTKRNPAKQSKGKSALKKTGRALKGFARGALSAGSEILGAGAMALNPVRRKVRNKYVDLVIKGQAKKTKDGWKVGSKTFAQGRGTVNVSSGYYLDRHTGMVYAKRQRNAEKKDSDHPIEVTKHWRAGPPGYLTPWQRAHAAGQSQLFETGIKPAKKRNAFQWHGRSQRVRFISGEYKGKTGVVQSVIQKRYTKEPTVYRIQIDGFPKPGGWSGKVTAEPHQLEAIRENPKHASRSIHPSRKKKGSRARAVSKTRAGSRRRSAAKTRKAPTKRATRNPSAESIRKKFAGSVSGSRDLFFPQGTPSGQLAKLGKLVLIQTEQGTIKPVHGTAWLCADTKERLHIGSTTNAPLFSGPARSFGKVTKVEYESSKPHLGYKGPIIWFHHMGERGGTRPTLHADGKGGLKFKGGNYKLTTRGIEH